MPTLSLRRFSNPDTLKHISNANLIALLSPYKEYLHKRGFTLPATNSNEIDYEALIGIFMAPKEDTPTNLSETLYLIDEMSSKEMMDKLLNVTKKKGIDFRPGIEVDPADVAVHLWLTDRTILEETHTEQQLIRPRAFLTFATTANPIPEFSPPDEKNLVAMQNKMDDTFEEKKRGRKSRVFTYQHKNECFFLVRHGEPWRRESTMSGSVFFHPQKHDVLIYSSTAGEIQIHADSKWEQELYLKCFGLYLFNDEKFFSLKNKYTLQPLVDYGRNALSTEGVEDTIEQVILKEISIMWGNEIEIRKTKSDLFLCFEKRKNPKIPENIFRAVFSVKFKHSKRPRSLTVQKGNKTSYDRNEDSIIIEKWLRRRGFIQGQNIEDETVQPMAGTTTTAIM